MDRRTGTFPRERPQRAPHRRSAAERRQQAARAQARVVQSLLQGFRELSAHRGCQPTQLGRALAAVLTSGQRAPEDTSRNEGGIGLQVAPSLASRHVDITADRPTRRNILPTQSAPSLNTAATHGNVAFIHVEAQAERDLAHPKLIQATASRPQVEGGYTRPKAAPPAATRPKAMGAHTRPKKAARRPQSGGPAVQAPTQGAHLDEYRAPGPQQPRRQRQQAAQQAALVHAAEWAPLRRDLEYTEEVRDFEPKRKMRAGTPAAERVHPHGVESDLRRRRLSPSTTESPTRDRPNAYPACQRSLGGEVGSVQRGPNPDRATSARNHTSVSPVRQQHGGIGDDGGFKDGQSHVNAVTIQQRKLSGSSSGTISAAPAARGRPNASPVRQRGGTGGEVGSVQRGTSPDRATSARSHTSVSPVRQHGGIGGDGGYSDGQGHGHAATTQQRTPSGSAPEASSAAPADHHTPDSRAQLTWKDARGGEVITYHKYAPSHHSSPRCHPPLASVQSQRRHSATPPTRHGRGFGDSDSHGPRHLPEDFPYEQAVQAYEDGFTPEEFLNGLAREAAIGEACDPVVDTPHNGFLTDDDLAQARATCSVSYDGGWYLTEALRHSGSSTT